VTLADVVYRRSTRRRKASVRSARSATPITTEVLKDDRCRGSAVRRKPELSTQSRRLRYSLSVFALCCTAESFSPTTCPFPLEIGLLMYFFALIELEGVGDEDYLLLPVWPNTTVEENNSNSRSRLA